MNKTRRKTLSDTQITDELISKIANKVMQEVHADGNITQGLMIDCMLPMNLSNATMARVINYILDIDSSTAGSVASIIRSRKGSSEMLIELLQLLEED